MGVERWSSERDPAVLGAVVHGPAVVAASPGIAIAVRCVVARPGALEIDLVVRAVGVQGEAACRQSFGEHPGRRDADDAWRGGSEPALVVQVDGARAVADLYEQTSSGGDEEFTSELRVAIGRLPSDGLLTLIASWPQAGLAESAVTLTLASLDDLDDRVVRLPS